MSTDRPRSPAAPGSAAAAGDLLGRLRAGSRWAHTRRQPRLAGLLSALADELATTRAAWEHYAELVAAQHDLADQARETQRRLAGIEAAMERLRAELAALRSALGDSEDMGIADEVLELQEAEHRHQIAITELELDTRRTESRISRLESEISELQEQTQAVQTRARKSRSSRPQRRQEPQSCTGRPRAAKPP